MRWFRLHAEILHDPRVQTLNHKLFKIYINLLCYAALKDDCGRIGNVSETAYVTHETEKTVSSAFHDLMERGLLGTENETFHIPQWAKKQYKSDTSTDRVKRFRKRFRNVSETAPDTDSDISSLRSDIGADAPDDPPSKAVSRETQGGVDKETPRQALRIVLDERRASAVVDHRAKLRKPLTAYAARLLAGRLAKARDGPNAAADRMIERGWIGYRPEWDENDTRSAAGKPQFTGVVANLRRMLDHPENGCNERREPVPDREPVPVGRIVGPR